MNRLDLVHILSPPIISRPPTVPPITTTGSEPRINNPPSAAREERDPRATKVSWLTGSSTLQGKKGVGNNPHREYTSSVFVNENESVVDGKKSGIWIESLYCPLLRYVCRDAWLWLAVGSSVGHLAPATEIYIP
jgi:hypothetical protein